MAYNTGNAMPSKDPRDLHDNANNFDSFSNGSAATYLDRFGVPRRSLAGVGMAFDESQLARDVQFQAFLVAAGYVWIGDYAAGITYTTRNQYVVREGSQYRLAPATPLPYTLTGVWVDDQPELVLMETAGTIMSQLAANTGAALVGTSESVSMQVALDRRLKGNIELNTTDLNTLTTAAAIGVYRQTTDALATLARHYPVATIAGTLEVFVGADDLAMQEYTTRTMQKFVRRCSDSGVPTWSAWREVSLPLGGAPGQVLTNTADGVGKWSDTKFEAGTHKRLRIVYPTVSSSSGTTTTTADWLVLRNAAGETLKLEGWARNKTQGADGTSTSLDTGTWTQTTQYSLYAIYNPTTDTRDLIWSRSTAAPLLPTGFTFYMRIGTNMSVSFSQMSRLRQGYQIGNKFTISRMDTGSLLNGAVGTWSLTTPTFVTINMAQQVPDTVSLVRLMIATAAALGTVSSSGAVMVAPDAGYSGVISSNPGPYCNVTGTTGNGASSYLSAMIFEMPVTSQTIYAVSTGTGCTLRVSGWEEDL
jgi:hypothetical protein